MRRTPAFWSAVRLLEFANLPATTENWLTLWPRGERRELWDHYRASAAAFGAPPGPVALFSQLNLNAASWPDTQGGFSEAVRAFRRFGRGLEELPHAPFPRGGRSGRITATAFLSLQKRTRERLELICENGDVTPLVHDLTRYRLPEGRFAHEQIAAGVLTRSNVRFQLLDDPTSPPSLYDHIRRLFISTALAGLWPRFHRCQWHGCGRFTIRQRSDCRSCSSRCRAEIHRERARLTDAERFRARVAALRKAGRSDAWEQACKEFRYSRLGPR